MLSVSLSSIQSQTLRFVVLMSSDQLSVVCVECAGSGQQIRGLAVLLLNVECWLFSPFPLLFPPLAAAAANLLTAVCRRLSLIDHNCLSHIFNEKKERNINATFIQAHLPASVISRFARLTEAQTTSQPAKH